MKNTLRILFPVLFVLFASACKPTYELYVIPAKDNFQLKPYSISYVLPQTRIDLKVFSTKVDRIPGPLAMYSKQYFSQLDAVLRAETYYRIDSVRIESSSLPDSTQIYFITTDNPDYLFNLDITNRGVLRSYGNKSVEIKSSETMEIEKRVVLENSYKQSNTDRSALLADFYSKSNKSEAADQLAKDIHTMQEDLHLLLIGEGAGQKQVEAESLKFMVASLKEKIDAYLTLFSGSVENSSMVNTYSVVPERINGANRRILFRFSEINGVMDSKSMEGTIVYLDIESLGITEQQNRWNANYKVLMSKNFMQHGLVFRNPETCVVRVLNENSVLVEKRVEVSQLGAINYLPANMLLQPLEFHFDENTGALLKIIQNGELPEKD